MKNSNSTYYKNIIPQLNLSVERNTGNVPNDGKYHVIYKGQIIDSFRSQKIAEQMFRELLKESGYKPELKHNETREDIDESLEQYFLAKEVYWAESYRHRIKGGKGR